MTYTVAALYRFTRVSDAPDVVSALREEFARLETLRGSLLVAPEGINGTLAGSPAAIEQLLGILSSRFGLTREEVKFSTANFLPFKRLKVKLKKEIVTLRQPQADPTVRVGEYVEPAAWNELITAPDVLVLDTRNVYETDIGTFENAVVPPIQNFPEFADYVRRELMGAKDKKIAMFCTGGIRCEKASAFMLAEGFDKVYHLKGGIINYLQVTPEEQSRWQGKCYVFDERGSVDSETAA